MGGNDNYYNDNDAYVAQWLRNLVSEGHIAPGCVDERSIKEVNRVRLACSAFDQVGHDRLDIKPKPSRATLNYLRFYAAHFAQNRACVPDQGHGFRHISHKTLVHQGCADEILLGFYRDIASLLFVTYKFVRDPDCVCAIRVPFGRFSRGGIHQNKFAFDLRPATRKIPSCIPGSGGDDQYLLVLTSSDEQHHISGSRNGYLFSGTDILFRSSRKVVFS